MSFNNTSGDGSNKKRIALIGGGVAVIVIILLLLLRSCGSAPAEQATGGSDTLTPGDGTVSAEELEGMTQEEIQEMLNEQAEAGYITISMNMYPTFSDGTSEGNLLIANTAPARELLLDGETVAEAEGVDAVLTFTYDGHEFTVSDDAMDVLDDDQPAAVTSADGAVTITFNHDGTYTCGDASGEYDYNETTGNHYSQIVEIYEQNLDGSLGKKIYTSPVIPVGKFVNSDKLDVDLDAGTYNCVACFYNVDENNAVMGQANALLSLTVEN